jgi:DNA primase
MCLYPGSGGFYCFGCHAHGDAIDLYGKALNLTKLEAARQVCRDFGFSYDEEKRRRHALARIPARRADAWALAKRLDAMREKQADGLLTRMRSAQEIIMQVAASKSNWDAVLDDAEWRRAMMEQ